MESLLGGWALIWVGLLAASSFVRGDPAAGVARAWDRPATAMGLRLAILGLGVVACALIGLASVDLPPGMHDEWSYLFQAETYSKGRFWLPSQNQIPGLFDQIHVLNEGRFASRYFPGTGLWLAPFVALGQPYWGQWLAAGLAALLIFETGRTIGGTKAGVVAGILVALAPGVAQFCNLLVSHAPTLLGIALFLCGFARARDERATDRTRLGWGLASGAGLAFAMLCRPLTAAAIGLPFGIVLLARTAATRRLLPLAAMAAPIAIGLLFMAWHDVSITGSIWKTPYGLYNDLYTPRHVYGFENGARGDAAQAVKRDVDYDRWARNLTGPLALRNARTRLDSSLEHSIGLVPFAVGLFVIAAAHRRGHSFWLLCAASIGTLHAAYLPYWFSGINGYHYVFEAIPLYALVFAGSFQIVNEWARQSGRPLLGPVWALLALAPAVWQWLPIGAPLQTSTGLALQRSSPFDAARMQHLHFRERVDERVTVRPALVLVAQPPVTFHVDFVVNPPTLDAPVLFGRLDPAKMRLADIESAFPTRAIYLFDPRRRHFERVDSRADQGESARRPTVPAYTPRHPTLPTHPSQEAQ